jgi:hypothetical protein
MTKVKIFLLSLVFMLSVIVVGLSLKTLLTPDLTLEQQAHKATQDCMDDKLGSLNKLQIKHNGDRERILGDIFDAAIAC